MAEYDCWQCAKDFEATLPETAPLYMYPTMARMFVCPVCQNKRCPRATDHRLKCTGSNEPKQAGSRYGGLDKPILVDWERINKENCIELTEEQIATAEALLAADAEVVRRRLQAEIAIKDAKIAKLEKLIDGLYYALGPGADDVFDLISEDD